MLRNLSIDLFCISYLFGYFRFIPNYILVIVIFSFLLDSFAYYNKFVNKKLYDKNIYLQNMINTYLKYTRPNSEKTPVWFFFDRFVVSLIFIYFMIIFLYDKRKCLLVKKNKL